MHISIYTLILYTFGTDGTYSIGNVETFIHIQSLTREEICTRSYQQKEPGVLLCACDGVSFPTLNNRIMTRASHTSWGGSSNHYSSQL
jgi:hypothetical protein